MKARTLLAIVALHACDVPVIRPNEVGLGYYLNSTDGCPRGLVIAQTDRSESANIAFASLSGQVLSPSMISSASRNPGLTAALGGDVVFPSMPIEGNELVLIDRYPKGVLTWVNMATAQVRAQLSVATGFLSNPHDYVSLAFDKAYVTRFNPNANAGGEVFDGGSDVLIIDPSLPAITGRIDLFSAFPPNGDFVAHPDRAWLVSGRVYVVIPFYNRPYTSTGQSYLAVIDPKTDSVIQNFPLTGLAGCSGLAVSPDRTNLAVACSGRWQGTNTADDASSALVGLRTTPEVSEIWRIPARQIGSRAFGFEIAFVDSTHVLATQLGEYGPPLVNDVAYVIDITTGAATRVLESANSPVTLSVGPCDATCRACFIADAGRSRLYSLSFSDERGPLLTGYDWADSTTGLPPTSLTFF